jgi:hypothetical protein
MSGVGAVQVAKVVALRCAGEAGKASGRRQLFLSPKALIVVNQASPMHGGGRTEKRMRSREPGRVVAV